MCTHRCTHCTHMPAHRRTHHAHVCMHRRIQTHAAHTCAHTAAHHAHMCTHRRTHRAHVRTQVHTQTALLTFPSSQPQLHRELKPANGEFSVPWEPWPRPSCQVACWSLRPWTSPPVGKVGPCGLGPLTRAPGRLPGSGRDGEEQPSEHTPGWRLTLWVRSPRGSASWGQSRTAVKGPSGPWDWALAAPGAGAATSPGSRVLGGAVSAEAWALPSGDLTTDRASPRTEPAASGQGQSGKPCPCGLGPARRCGGSRVALKPAPASPRPRSQPPGPFLTAAGGCVRAPAGGSS